MNAEVPIAPTADPELSLCLLEGVGRPEPGRIAGIGLASIALNLLLLTFLATLASIEGSPPKLQVKPLDTAKSTPLVFPKELTQKEPNNAQVAKEVHLADLVPQPEVPAQKRVFTPPPAPKMPAPQAPAPVPTVEPPKMAMVQPPPPAAGDVPNIPPPPVQPPQIQATEKPKLAFETPGLQPGPVSSRPSGLGRIVPPKATVEDAVRSAVRSGPGGVVIGDQPDEGGIGSILGQSHSPSRQASRVELLSDPQGVDFKPYLVQVLMAVRRNWMSVIPETARLGRQGKVVIQFSINKGGGVPKLVIAMPSGTESLDRAAVAGISASNPFPPLPGEFKGDQIRVQLVFFYNVASR